MKKKLFVLLILSFFCAACDANYNLEINNETLSENISLTTDLTKQEEYQGRQLTSYFEQLNKEKHAKYYDDESLRPSQSYETNIETTENMRKFNINGDFNLNNFYRSRAIKSCFNEFDIQKSENYILLRTNNRCALFDNYSLLENLTINIKTDLEVIVSNADNVNGNIYTWNINRNNYKNKSVHITYVLEDSTKEENTIESPEEEPNVKEETPEETTKKVKNYNILIFGACLGVLIVVIFIVLRFKKKKF